MASDIVNLKLPADEQLRQRLRIIALKQGTTMQDIITKLVREYVERNEKEDNSK